MINPPEPTGVWPKRGGVSYDPVQSTFNVDLSQIHILGINIDYYRASPLVPDDNLPDVMLECIIDDNLNELQGIRRWNAIQALERLSLQGLLRYYECHITKKPDSNGCDIKMITEFAHASLKTILSPVGPLELTDLIQMMIQVSTTLCELEKAGYSHQSINPETIVMKRLDNGTIKYMLAASIFSIDIRGKKYTEREEYSPYIAPDQSYDQRNIKHDVYSLGMVFLEMAGVNMDTLMKLKKWKASSLQESHDNTVLGELVHLVLQAVNQDYTKRLSPNELREKLEIQLGRVSDSIFTKNDFVLKFEEIIASSNLKLPSQEQNHEQIRVDIGRNRDNPVDLSDSISPIIRQDGVPRRTSRISSRVSKKTLSRAFCMTSLILSLMTIGFVIVILYKGFVNLSASDQLAGAMDSIYENLNTIPFSEITVESTSCPSGYTSISSLGNWVGTTGFCYDMGFVDITTGSSGCDRYYDAQGSQNYSKWKDIVICGKPATGFSNSSTCSASQTSCYTGVCVSDTECPISQIQFSTAAQSADGWTSVQYNTSLFINYRRDSGTLPLSTFRINIGEAKSCLSNLEYSAQQNYPAYKINGTGCIEYGGFPNPTTIDTENALLMLSEQTWSSEVVKLPEYTDLLNKQTAYLTASPRIELASSCSSMNFDSLKVGAGGLKAIRTLTQGFGFAAIIAICLPLVVLCAPVLLACGSRGTGGGDCDGKCLLFCVVFGLFLSYPATAVILIPAAVKTRSHYTYVEPYFTEYQAIAQSKCFVDAQVMATVQQFIGALTTARTIYYLWIGLAVPFWILFAFWLYFGFLLAIKRHR